MSLRPSPFLNLGASRRVAAPERVPDVAPRPDLRLLEGGPRQGAGHRRGLVTPRLRLITCVGGIGVVLFAVVAFHVVLSQGQFKLDALQSKASVQQDKYERLRLQVAQLESPARITSEARRLGMTAPDKVTPVTPGQGDMPKGDKNAPSTSAGPAAPPTTPDPGSWDKVKPHLANSSK